MASLARYMLDRVHPSLYEGYLAQIAISPMMRDSLLQIYKDLYTAATNNSDPIEQASMIMELNKQIYDISIKAPLMEEVDRANRENKALQEKLVRCENANLVLQNQLLAEQIKNEILEKNKV